MDDGCALGELSRRVGIGGRQVADHGGSLRCEECRASRRVRLLRLIHRNRRDGAERLALGSAGTMTARAFAVALYLSACLCACRRRNYPCRRRVTLDQACLLRMGMSGMRKRRRASCYEKQKAEDGQKPVDGQAAHGQQNRSDVAFCKISSGTLHEDSVSPTIDSATAADSSINCAFPLDPPIVGSPTLKVRHSIHDASRLAIRGVP